MTLMQTALPVMLQAGMVVAIFVLFRATSLAGGPTDSAVDVSRRDRIIGGLALCLSAWVQSGDSFAGSLGPPLALVPCSIFKSASNLLDQPTICFACKSAEGQSSWLILQFAKGFWRIKRRSHHFRVGMGRAGFLSGSGRVGLRTFRVGSGWAKSASGRVGLEKFGSG